jgi:hypothetical protein
MRLEDERIRSEREQREESQRREAERLAEDDRRSRAAVEAKEKEAREREESDRRAAREEEARLAGLQAAIVERAKLETQARLDAERKQHELRAAAAASAALAPIEPIGIGPTPKRVTFAGAAAMAVGAFVIALATCGGAYAGVIAPRARAAESAQAERIHEEMLRGDQESAKRVALEQRVTEQDRRIAELEDDKAALKKQLDAIPVPKKTNVGGGGGWVPPRNKDPKGPCINAHDPLCGDLNVK